MPDDAMDLDDEGVKQPWPPPLIAKWLRSQTVNCDKLVQELDYWARHMAGDSSGPHYVMVGAYLRAVPESDELVRLRAERDAAMALLAKVVSVAPRKALPWVSPLSLSFGSTPLTLEESALMKRATDEYAALSPDEAAEYVYRTTNTVRCEWCGAEPGQSCRLEPGRYAGYGTTEKFHTIRVDPTSEPVGILGPKREGNAFREILPLPEAPEEGGP